MSSTTEPLSVVQETEQLHICIPSGSDCVIPADGCLVQFISQEDQETRIDEVAGDKVTDQELEVSFPGTCHALWLISVDFDM